MTGVETQLIGRVVGEAAKPLFRNVKRSLARRGFGKTNFYDEVDLIERQLGEVPTLGLLFVLPKGVTARDISALAESPALLQYARVRLSAELAGDDVARNVVEKDIEDLFFETFRHVDSDELVIYAKRFLEQLGGHCSNIKLKLNKRLTSREESLSWAYENISNAYIASLRVKGRSGGEVPFVSRREVEVWQRRYRDVFDSFHRGIEIPDLSNRRKVDYTKLFVGSKIAPTSKPSADLVETQEGRPAVTDESMLSLVNRTVLLGDPGAGKSTTSNVLAIRAWEALNVIPIIIVMKEIREIYWGFPVVDHIESMMKAKYQCPVSEGVIERLLLDGRILLVFDGLDELVNGAQRKIAAQVIEIASRSYPLSRVLVTSRRTGYSIARLDPEVFDEFQLDAFDVTQVEEYATKWLGLQTTTNSNELEELVADFMRTSESIHDLRTNPLLLAVICVLYRGHRSIPRRRPELYRRCVELLLAEWDRARGITDEDAETDLYEIVLTRLAYLVATEPEKNGKLTEEKVFDIGVPALLDEEVPTEREARKIVSDVLRLCRGRAWIFTDVGLDEQGNDIFGFTHASFIEYFAARHIYRSMNSPEDIARELIPRVAAGQWEVLAQICLSLGRSGKVAGGSRVIVRMLDHVDNVLATSLADRHRSALSYSTMVTARASSYQTEGDVAIVDFLLRASDTLPMSSETLSRLIRLSMNQLAEGRSRTLGVMLEKRYRYQAETCNRVSEYLNDGIERAVRSGTTAQDAQRLLPIAWLTAHFPYMLRFPGDYKVSAEAVRDLSSRLRIPAENWVEVASRSSLWRQLSLHVGKGEIVCDDAASRACAYAEMFEPLSPPIADFGPVSTATWIVDCLEASDAVAMNSHRAVRVLRQFGATVGSVPFKVATPPHLSLAHIELSVMPQISRRLHGYGKNVVAGWLVICLGLLELTALVRNKSRHEIVEYFDMNKIFEGYGRVGMFPRTEYDEWLNDYEHVWLADTNQITG